MVDWEEKHGKNMGKTRCFNVFLAVNVGFFYASSGFLSISPEKHSETRSGIFRGGGMVLHLEPTTECGSPHYREVSSVQVGCNRGDQSLAKSWSNARLLTRCNVCSPRAFVPARLNTVKDLECLLSTFSETVLSFLISSAGDLGAESCLT